MDKEAGGGGVPKAQGLSLHWVATSRDHGWFVKAAVTSGLISLMERSDSGGRRA